jgi:hypothetical protein
MSTPEPLISDERIGELIKSVLMDEPNHSPHPEGTRLVRRVSYIIRTEYEADRAAHLARIAELEAKLAASKPGERKSEIGVRAGLLKGRIRTKGVREPSVLRPTFDAALQMATTGDLMWALELLIKHPNAKRTWRDYRIKHIDKRLREIMAAGPRGLPEATP